MPARTLPAVALGDFRLKILFLVTVMFFPLNGIATSKVLPARLFVIVWMVFPEMERVVAPGSRAVLVFPKAKIPVKPLPQKVLKLLMVLFEILMPAPLYNW